MARVKGIRAVRQAIKRMEPQLRLEVSDVIESTVADVARDARANIEAMVGTSEKPYVTVKGVKMRRKLLRRLYRTWTNQTTLKGRVGYLSKASREKAYYARFVHDGTAHSASHPFHQNAVDAAKPRFNSGAQAALRRALGKTLPK